MLIKNYVRLDSDLRVIFFMEIIFCLLRVKILTMPIKKKIRMIHILLIKKMYLVEQKNIDKDLF